jgi:hypothetical protein
VLDSVSQDQGNDEHAGGRSRCAAALRRCGEAGANVPRMNARKKMLRDLWASAQISLKCSPKSVEFSWLRMA